jgi:hypothetical protein
VRMKLHQSIESHRGASMKASSTSADGAVHFNTYAHMVNVDPDKNRYRFYTLTKNARYLDRPLRETVEAELHETGHLLQWNPRVGIA